MYFCSLKRDVPVAQLVEQLTLNQWVQGSNPCGDTEKTDLESVFFFIYCTTRFRGVVPKCSRREPFSVSPHAMWVEAGRTDNGVPGARALKNRQSLKFSVYFIIMA